MALSRGTTAANAASATQVYNVLATALAAAGWEEETTRTYTASIMGTTADVKVWVSYATLNGSSTQVAGNPSNITSGIYTGCIVTFEVDDTNDRIRVRCCEMFDSSVSGASGLNTKFPCPGNQSNTAQTPTVANSAISDNYLTHFQTQGVSATVGWVNIPTSEAGTPYILGANASEVFLSTNVTQWNWCHAGKLSNACTTFGPTGAPGSSMVFLGGRMTATNTNVSWTFGAANGAGNYRVSREPGNSGTSTTGAFCYVGSTYNPPLTAAPGPYTAIGVSHRFLGNKKPLYSVWLFGVNSSAIDAGSNSRTYLGRFDNMAVGQQNSWETTVSYGDLFEVGSDDWYTVGKTGANNSSIYNDYFGLCVRDGGF